MQLLMLYQPPYESRSHRLFFSIIYEGEQRSRPEELTQQDSREPAFPYGTNGRMVSVERFRDVQKLHAFMTDGKAEYVLYGVENQSEVHYAMAVKNNLYDAINYAGQVEKTARAHRRAMSLLEMMGEVDPKSGWDWPPDNSRNFSAVGNSPL